MNPFEYANAINYTKKNIMVDDIAEKASFELMDYSNKSLGLTFSGDIDAKKHILKIFLYFYGKEWF